MPAGILIHPVWNVTLPKKQNKEPKTLQSKWESFTQDVE